MIDIIIRFSNYTTGLDMKNTIYLLLFTFLSSINSVAIAASDPSIVKYGYISPYNNRNSARAAGPIKVGKGFTELGAYLQAGTHQDYQILMKTSLERYNSLSFTVDLSRFLTTSSLKLTLSSYSDFGGTNYVRSPSCHKIGTSKTVCNINNIDDIRVGSYVFLRIEANTSHNTTFDFRLNRGNKKLTPRPPKNPSTLTATVTPRGSYSIVDLKWKDRSNDEHGFHIWHDKPYGWDDKLLLTLPKNSTSARITIPRWNQNPPIRKIGRPMPIKVRSFVRADVLGNGEYLYTPANVIITDRHNPGTYRSFQ